jgi:outer membrane lipoprotein carrier protein
MRLLFMSEEGELMTAFRGTVSPAKGATGQARKMASWPGRAIGFAVLILFAVPASPVRALDDPAMLLQKIQQHYASVSSLRANFVQREKVATLGRLRESRGTLALKRPGRMRWDYDTPEKQTIITEGTVVWIHHPDEKMVYRFSLDRGELSRTPVALLFQEGRSLSEFFKATSALPEGDGTVHLDLKPINQSQELSAVSLTVRPADGMLLGTIIRDAFGNVTEVRLEQIKENPSLDDALFVFKTPAGTKVLDGKPGNIREP